MWRGRGLSPPSKSARSVIIYPKDMDKERHEGRLWISVDSAELIFNEECHTVRNEYRSLSVPISGRALAQFVNTAKELGFNVKIRKI